MHRARAERTRPSSARTAASSARLAALAKPGRPAPAAPPSAAPGAGRASAWLSAPPGDLPAACSAGPPAASAEACGALGAPPPTPSPDSSSAPAARASAAGTAPPAWPPGAAPAYGGPAPESAPKVLTPGCVGAAAGPGCSAWSDAAAARSGGPCCPKPAGVLPALALAPVSVEAGCSYVAALSSVSACSGLCERCRQAGERPGAAEVNRPQSCCLWPVAEKPQQRCHLGAHWTSQHQAPPAAAAPTPQELERCWGPCRRSALRVALASACSAACVNGYA